MAIATLYTELDLDMTKFQAKQKKLLDDIKKVATDSETALQRSFMNLGVTSDKVYDLMAEKARVSYERITQSANVSIVERTRAYAAYSQKIQAIDEARNAVQKAYLRDMTEAYQIEAIKKTAIQEKQNLENSQYWTARMKFEKDALAQSVAAQKQASDAVIALREKENLANQQFWTAKMAYDKKVAAESVAAQTTAQAATRSMGLMQIAAVKEDADRTLAIKNKAKEAELANYTTLGMKSAASINEQIANVQKAATAQQAIVGKSSDDWVRIERAKNEKLKALNKEMTGEHEMSMASMTRMLLRFYAAYYVLTTAGQAIGTFFMGGIKAIDDMKLSTIGVAAQITTMQGTTGDIAKNYKDNLKYAEALIPVLQQVDVNSFANLSQIQKMNMAMSMQGTILDVNNAKQIESFTALTNAVALFTQGQDKERQASQEIRALFSGQVREGNMVALMIDQQIKKTGEYKDGLKGLVEEGRKYGNTLELLTPYLTGIIAASGDIQSTWAAVSSSIETTWNIMQRGLFKDAYKSLVESGQIATTWLKANQDEVVQYIKIAWGFIADIFISVWNILKGFAPMVTDFGKAVGLVAYDWGKVLAVLKPIGDFLGNSIALTYELVKMLGHGAVAIGALAMRQFEVADIAWEEAKKSANRIADLSEKNKKILETDVSDSIAQYEKQYKAKEKVAQVNVTRPIIPPGADKKEKDSVKDHMESLRARMQGDKAYYDEQVKTAEQEAKLSQRAGQNELLTINTLYNNKQEALYNYLQVEYANAEELVKLEKRKAIIGKDEASRRFDADMVLASKKDAIDKKYSKDSAKNEGERAIAVEDANKKTISTMAALYSTIAQYSQDSIDFQIKLLKDKYEQEGRYDDNALALAAAMEVEINGLREKADKYWADYYSNIDGYALNSYNRKISLIERTRQAEIKAAEAGIKNEKEKAGVIGAANTKAKESTITAIGEKFDAENKYVKQVITNTGAMLDAAMTMYNKDSSEYARLAEWKKAIQVAQLAMEAAKNIQLIAGYFAVSAAASGAAVATAGAAVAGAAIGVGPTGFATAAAMLALMASVFSMFGIIGGSGSGSGSVPSAPTAGYGVGTTALGGKNDEASQSISNSWELMQDTYDMQDTKLTGIYNEMKQLNANITGIVRGIVTGGIGSLTMGGLGTQAKAKSELQTYTEIASLITGPGLGILIVDKLFGTNFGNQISNWLFGSGSSSTSQTASGLMVGGGAVKPYATSTTRSEWSGAFGGLFGGGGSSTTYNRMEGAVNEVLTNLFYGEHGVYPTLKKSVADMARMLGGDVAMAENKVFAAFELNLMGMSSDDIEKAVSGQISAISDNFVREVFASLINAYQEVGEGAYETISRLAIDLMSVKNILEQTNQVFYGGSKSIVAFTESVIEMAGGLDKLTEAASNYYDKFFTDAEKQVDLQSNLLDVFASMNLTLPATRDGYRNLVESLNLNTTAGQEAYVTLMKLAEGADTFYSGLEDAQQEFIDAQGEVVDTMQGYVDKLKAARESMKLEGTEAAAVVVANAKAIFNAVLVAARGGDFSGIATLDSVLSTLTSSASSSAGFSTLEDYQRNFYQTLNSIAELEGLAGGQLTIEQQTLSIMQQQLNELIVIAATTTEALAVAREQQAIAALQLESARTLTAQAELAAVQAQLTATQAQLTQAQNAPPPSPGDDFFASIGNIFGWAEGGISTGPDSGYMTKLHGTEAVVPLSGGRSIPVEIKSNNNVILISEVRALREELKAGNLKNGRYIEKTSKWLEKFDNDGIAVRVP